MGKTGKKPSKKAESTAKAAAAPEPEVVAEPDSVTVAMKKANDLKIKK